MRLIFFCLGLALGVGDLVLASPAKAQAKFNIGPQVGAASSISSYSDQANFSNGGRPYQTRYLAGFEAGVAGALTFGNLEVQPALLFSQRGFRIEDDYINYYYHATTSVRLRLNYLCLPLSVAYTFRATGHGLQVFAGPYVGLLLGGTYTFHNTYGGYRRLGYAIQGTLPVEGSGRYRSGSNDPAAFNPTGPTPQITTYYSRRVDAGLQVGLGYRFGNSLVRAGYSLGLTNPGVGSQVDYGGSAGVYIKAPPSYSNQAFQLSFAYLFWPRSNS